MSTRLASPGMPPWSRVLSQSTSPTSPRWRTLSLACGHVVTLVRNKALPPQRFARCTECPAMAARPPKGPPLTKSQVGRIGWQARRASSTPEERSRCARLGGVASARSTAPRRAELAARAHAAAVDGAKLIREAVRLGIRVDLRMFAEARDVPHNRLRATFAALTGVTWGAAHRATI